MSDRLPHPQLLLSLNALRDRALQAETLNALTFSMANDLYPLLKYRQALVMAQRADKLELLCVSGLAKPTEDSPYLIWLARASRWLSEQLPDNSAQWIARETLDPPADIAEGWSEWWPTGIFCVPIVGPAEQRVGIVLFLLDQPPQEPLLPLLDSLWKTWSYCWAALTVQHKLFGWRPSKRQLLISALVLCALLLVPVRQTVLAPAEIVSQQAQVVSSPIDGVISQMHVRPNQSVDAGTLLFTLDETTLRNRADVLAKEVAVADAELLAASQRAFDNIQSKSELTLLNGRAQQRRAELDAVRAQLQRTQVNSPTAGVAVFSDPNDWLGKPVVTGERILQVANPKTPAMRIQLPVADAIALDPGAPVTLYLTAYPLSPLQGQVLETSYKAKPTDEGVVAYRLLASVDGESKHARLGLHGTAKLYGEHVMLGYYLLRRPLSAVRAWTGW